MSRSSDTIQKSMGDSIHATNPSVDVVKGAIPYIILKPVADEMEPIEAEQERLGRLYSILWRNVMSDSEIEAFGRAYGVPRGIGSPAIGRVTFYTTSRPAVGSVIVIPAGTIVTTGDRSIAVQTLDMVQIIGNNADLYYNPATRFYEVTAVVSSVSIGEEVDIAEYNLTICQVDGISGCENRSRIEGGTGKESKDKYGERVASKFLGMSTGTGGGIEQLFTNSAYKNDLTGLALVWSTDLSLYKRRDADGPALDAYVTSANNELSYAFNYDAIGGETSLSFPIAPILSVAQVVVDGTIWTEGAPINGWMLQQDSSVEYRLSSRASDRITLSTPLLPGQRVGIDCTYDRIVWGLQDTYDKAFNKLFETDCLVRQSIKHPLVVKVKIIAMPSADVVALQANAMNAVLGFCNPGYSVSQLSPKDLKELLSDSSSIHGSGSGGPATVFIQKFTSQYSGTAEVEVVYFTKQEIPYSDDTLIDIRVTQ